MASGNTIPYAIRYTFSNVSNLNGVRLANPYQGNPGGNPFPYTGGLFPVGGPVQPTSTNATNKVKVVIVITLRRVAEISLPNFRVSITRAIAALSMPLSGSEYRLVKLAFLIHVLAPRD